MFHKTFYERNCKTTSWNSSQILNWEWINHQAEESNTMLPEVWSSVPDFNIKPCPWSKFLVKLQTFPVCRYTCSYHYFQDFNGLLWGPRSNLRERLCYMCSVCIYGDLLLLNQAGWCTGELSARLVSCDNRLLWLCVRALIIIYMKKLGSWPTGASHLVLCLWSSLE